LDLLTTFAKEGFPANATKSDIIERLVKSRLLDAAIIALLDEGKFGHDDPTFKPRTSRRHKAVCLLLEHIFAKSSKDSSQEPELKINWWQLRRQHHSKTEELLFSNVTDNESRRGLETLCYKLGVW